MKLLKSYYAVSMMIMVYFGSLAISKPLAKKRLFPQAINVEIIDQRPQVEARKIRIPLNSFPGQNDKVAPVLSERNKRLIDKQIKDYYKGRERNTYVKCYFLESYQAYVSKATHDQEYAYTEVKIELYDENRALLKTCHAQTSLENTPKKSYLLSMNSLYNKTLKLAIDSCLAQTAGK